jgi:hypothetical protein
LTGLKTSDTLVSGKPNVKNSSTTSCFYCFSPGVSGYLYLSVPAFALRLSEGCLSKTRTWAAVS